MRRVRQMRREMASMLESRLRDNWRALASLPLRERVKLAYWMLIGKKELPKGGE